MGKTLLLSKIAFRILFSFLFVFSFSFTQVDAQNVIYVDASATSDGDGTSWANAYDSLQPALAGTNVGDTLWVAGGTYKPTNTTNRDTSFVIPNSVSVYGGFEGTESQLSQRDWRNNETILSGDIGTEGDTTDNSYHVVSFNNASNQTVLDGFTITLANNDDVGNGGGIYLVASGSGNNCEPLIRNSKISNNYADDGGGIFILGNGGTASPELMNCTFSGNHAISGGGIYTEADNSGTVTPTFKNCIITGNKADNFGGAAYNWIAIGGSGTTAPIFINTTISGNYAGDYGSALYNVYSNCTPTLRNCILWGNVDPYSQISNNTDANPSFSYCNIDFSIIGGSWHDDFGTDDGGNIEADPLFLEMPDSAQAPTTSGNVALAGNSPCINMGYPTEDTTGWSIDRSGNPRIYADTIDMGALECQNLAPYVVSEIEDQILPEHSPDTAIADLNEVFSDYEQNSDLTFQVDSNSNPSLVAGSISEVDSTLVLSFNAENEGAAYIRVSATDDLGEMDTVSFTVTVNKIPELFYVDSAANGNNDGKSWNDAYNYLQDALAYASQGDTIWIASGTYYPDEGDGYQDNARDSSFMIPDSVKVYGGFAGTEEQLNERDLSIDPTILHGDIDQSDSIDNNSLHVVTFKNVSSETLLDGITITGGLADGSFPDNRGGGIFNDGSGSGNRSNPRIVNCIIAGNKAGKGGGVYNHARSSGITNPLFVNCSFKGNSSGEGGGIYNDGYGGESSPKLINCTFSGNTGSNSGALYNMGLDGVCSPSLINCNIWGNESKQQQITNASGATISYDYCNLEWRAAQGTNINSDPFFVNMPDYTTAPTINGNLNVYSNSPCINSGDNSAVDTIQTDLTGAQRIQDGTADIGAYEGGVPVDARRIYVDRGASGNNDGSSWTDAYTSLQEALEQASFADSIWVAAGTYLPVKDKDGNSSPSDACTKTFFIPGHISVYGGFEGTETLLSQRNPDVNETILSGDLGTAEDSTDNAYHVVYFEDVHEMTILSGFTIKDGNADGSDQYGRGGGIYNVASDYGYESNPRIYHCTITENNAVHGGGIYHDGEQGECMASLNNCIISSNKATGNGGGIYNRDCNPELINCTITENHASQEGGGVYNYAYSTASNINPVLTNCLVYANIADDDGGAISNRGNGASNPSLINCTLAGNQATNNGGSIYNNFGEAGGPRIINSIIWGNNSDIYNGSNADPTISFSNIENSGGSGENWNASVGNDKGNNIDENPRFIDMSGYQSIPDNSDGFRLYESSPCINTGANDSISEPYDLAGDNRIQEGTVDMGVFEGGEAITEQVIYVDSSASGNQDGTSWTDAYVDLSNALISCNFGDTIWVAEGTYYPMADKTGNESPSDNRTKTFSIPDQVSVYGGFNGNETHLEERHPDTNRTILSGDLGTIDDDSDNAYHVVYFDHVDEGTLLDGFDITAGKADGSNSEGGGIYNDGSGFATSSPLVQNCRIINNIASDGGGVYSEAENYKNRLKLINCLISGNNAGNYGGGLYSYAYDGGIDSTVLINCVFSGNSAGYYGGGIYTTANNGTCNPYLINCTLTANKAMGSAMYNNESDPTLTNCILWNNSGDEISNTLNATPLYAYCNIEGSGGSDTWNSDYGVDGGNNMDEDPHFVMNVSSDNAPTTKGDFRLYEGSPCIDTADNTVNSESYDLAGNTRIKNEMIDMGAYEGGIPIPTAYYVDQDANGNNDGLSWENAYTNLQDALSRPNKEKVSIWVADGVYYPDEGYEQTNDDPNSTFDIPDSIKVYGGFAGNETALNERDWKNHETILNGDLGIVGDNTDNAYHVVTFEGVSEETVLDGLTITKGNAGAGYGGGIYNIAPENGNRSKPHITNCTIKNNTAKYNGRGIYNKCELDTDESSPVLDSCIISYNEGGGIYNDAGGGYEASPVLINSIISGNNGNGIYNYGNGGKTSPHFSNCIISDNKGAGIKNYSSNAGESNPTMVNCNIVGNEDYGMINNNGGGACSPELINSVLWNNNTVNSGVQVDNNNASPSYIYSDIQGSGGSMAWNSDLGVDEGNNIDADPVFINEPDYNTLPTTEGDYHLFTASPCIDAGLNDSVSLSTDLDGEARIQNGTVDMGAYEGGDADTISPVLETNDTTFMLDETGMASIQKENVVILASDNLSIADTSLSRSEFDCSDIGVVSIEVTLTDDSENQTIQNADVTVKDTIKPSFNAQNVTVYLDASGNASVKVSDLLEGVMDNCSIADTSVTQTDFTTEDIGDVPVDVTVTDFSGNSTTETAIVTVNEEALSKYTITFSVTDESSGAIEGADISLRDEVLATTNTDGTATIDTTDGTYEYTVSKSGYNSETGSVTIDGSDVKEEVMLTEESTGIYTIGDKKINIYPNPANDKVFVRLEEMQSEAVIKLFNIHGQLTRTYRIPASGQHVTEPLDVTGLNKGIYLIQIDYGEGRVTRRLILE